MRFNIFNFFPLLKFRIEENSMSPFLNPDDMVIIFRTKNVKKNDVVVFEKPASPDGGQGGYQDYYIKRVKQIKPSFAKASEDAEFFVEGDNKKESIDSREFGWIDRENIVGKVIYKI